MSIEIRAARAEEFPTSAAPISHYFGRLPTPEQAERFAERFADLLPSDRMHVAVDDGAVVGNAGAFPFETSVPGGFVRAAGITMVGVLPTHRRRGIFAGLMNAQLDDIRERGEAIAYLWASDDSLYGRFGYGMASFSGRIEIPRDRSAFYRDFEAQGTVRLLDVEEAITRFSEVQRRAAAQHPGMFVRTPEWWRNKRMADHESDRRGGGDLVRALLELDGGPAAYALYRLHFSADGGIAQGFTNVLEAVGDSPQATRAIWRYLFDIDWMDRVRADLLPLDHELFLLMREPRRLSFGYRDGLWVRLVDVDAALNARTFKAGDPVVLDVLDERFPSNTGRWRVASDGAERTTDDAEIVVPAAALASVYLGGFTFGQLARARRVDELSDGALDRADALFRSDRYPWCPEIF